MIDLALLLADGAQPAAAGSWLTPELAGFLAALIVSLAANVLSALGRREAAARAAAAAPLLGSVAGAIAMVRREGRLDAVSQAALLGALKQTSAALGVSSQLDALAQAAKAAPDALGAVKAAEELLAPPATGDVVRRITGRL